MKFDVTYCGLVYAMNGGTLYSYRGGLFRGVSVSANFDGTTYTNGAQVALTGYYVTSSRGNVGWQTTGGQFIILSEGWQKVGTVAVNRYSDKAAQALVNKIIANNKIILCNNLFCARFASRLTKDERDQVRALQERLQARNDALQAEGLIRQDSIEQNYPSGYAELSEYLDKLMAGEAVGVAVSTIVWIVVACVVLAGAGTAAYYAYKHLAEESERDVKFSKELNEILMAKLTPEEYAQLKKETADIVTKAKLRQLFTNYKNVLTYAAIAFLGFSLYKIIKNRE